MKATQVGKGDLSAHDVMRQAKKLDAQKTAALYVEHATKNGVRISVDLTKKNDGPRFLRQIRRHIIQNGVDL